MQCDSTYVVGDRWRRGLRCPYAANTIINLTTGALRVCGYHARGYTPEVQHPFDWNLARIRRWRLQNLDDLLTR